MFKNKNTLSLSIYIYKLFNTTQQQYDERNINIESWKMWAKNQQELWNNIKMRKENIREKNDNKSLGKENRVFCKTIYFSKHFGFSYSKKDNERLCFEEFFLFYGSSLSNGFNININCLLLLSFL